MRQTIYRFPQEFGYRDPYRSPRSQNFSLKLTKPFSSQIIKIMSSGSAKGLSFTGVLLELVAVTANGAYSYSKGFPFSSYGESIFMSLQVQLSFV